MCAPSDYFTPPPPNTPLHGYRPQLNTHCTAICGPNITIWKTISWWLRIYCKHRCTFNITVAVNSPSMFDIFIRRPLFQLLSHAIHKTHTDNGNLISTIIQAGGPKISTPARFSSSPLAIFDFTINNYLRRDMMGHHN